MEALGLADVSRRVLVVASVAVVVLTTMSVVGTAAARVFSSGPAGRVPDGSVSGDGTRHQGSVPKWRP